MTDAALAAALDHPRGTWFDPAARALVGQAALLDRLANRRAILLGETHDVAEIHRWQLHVTAALHARRPNLAVGFEMFPRSTQPVLDRWVAGDLGTDAFLAEVGWFQVWGFDPELYLPLFHFCRQQGVPMLALNCYRALVTRVRKEGWDAIPEAERDGLTPSAPPLQAYREWLASLMGRLRGESVQIDPAFDGFIAAQQTWDRAFACNIVRALERPGGPELVVGIVGRGHLEHGYGTPYQLADLGVRDSAVLLTAAEGDDPARALAPGIAEAVFRLDRPEPAAGRPPKLGLELAAGPAETGEAGLEIAAVAPETPAAKAGLVAGDRLLQLAGRPVATPAEVLAVTRRAVAGSLLPLLVVRNGEVLTLTLPVLAPPPPGRPG